MAPALPNSKRKRGGPVRSHATAGDVGDASRRAARKRTASKRDQLQEEDMIDEEADHDANPRPSKRGRPRKDDNAATNTPETSTRIAPNSRRRAQDTEAQDEEQEAEGSIEGSGSLRRSTRERRSADAQPWWVSGAGDDSVIAEQEAETPSVGPEKRGQRPAQGSTPASQQPPASKEPRRKRGERVAKTATEESPAEAEVEPKRRGRKRTSGGAEASTQVSQAKPARRRRSSPVTEAAGRNRDSAPKARRRSKADSPADADPIADDDDMEDSQGAPPVKYRHIASRTRQIPRSTISAKWTPLEEASIGAVSALVSDTSRPVLLRLQGREQRHQQAHNALRAFASRLHSKLRKGIPFPPPSTKAAPSRNSRSDGPDSGVSHADEFDFERTVNSIQSLEATLNPLLHSVSLLKSERDKEEGALEKDYEVLRTLEANARAEVRGWKERGRRAHALAPGSGRVEDAPKGVAEAKLEVVKSGRKPPVGIFKGIEDEEIKTLSRRLGSHVESMRGNLQPIAELLPAITKSRAALQGVLHNHLGAQQYDKAFVD